ncbi:formin-like protein 18 isoform X2 [Primulina huaijiensis]|uniref:formin-like protein 18 isoform X2 n=1 Tax=Primulina huaijiensis TaxID=1492673 RepID=UPI003CC75A6D
MALLRKFFYRKPPEGLLEISERVFVFDCCFTTNGSEDDGYNVYIGHIVDRLCEYFPEASIMVFNFGEGDQQTQVTNLLSKYNMTVIDYPRQYENCPLLTVEMIHHFLRSSESWLSLGQRNLLLLHCQMDALPVMAFTLAALLIYRKQYAGEQKTLEMMYKQAPREILRLLSPLNPLPSQLRYLQYVSRRNTGSQWPPLDGALTLDRVFLRCIPDMYREGGCRPIIRIYGHDPLMVVDGTTKLLFSMPQTNKAVRQLKRADCEVNIDIHCHVHGDVVLECITLDDNLKLENMMFRVMFNTAFIGSNVLILTPDEIDTPWNVKDLFPEDFRAEVLFSEMNSLSSLVGLHLPGSEYEDLPVEAFVEVHDALNNSDLLVPNSVQKDKFSGDAHDDRGFLKESPSMVVVETPKSEVFENETMISRQIAINETHWTFSKSSLDKSLKTSENEKREPQVVVQRPAKCKVISQRASPTSISTPALYSNSFQCAPIAISKYHGAPSALGITALLHDHAEFNKEAYYSSKPSAPEQTILGKQSNNSETRKDSTPLPPQLPPPPPPPSLFRSTRSLHPPVSPSVPQSPPSLLSLEVPPVSPRPLSSPSLPATCQIHHSKSSGIHSSLPSSSLLLQLRQESPPLQSLVRVSVTPPPPSPPPSQSMSYLSVPVQPSIQFGLDCKMSAHIRQQFPMPHLPPPPPLCTAYNTSLSSSGKSFSPTPVSSPSCFSEMASTPRIDQSQVVFPTNLPRPLTPNSYSRNQSSGPPPHSSSVKKALPSFQSTSSAPPPPPPPPPPQPFLGKAKSPSLLSFPLPPPPSATSTSPSPKILQPVAPPPSCIKETASLPSIRDLSLASPVSTPALPSSIGPTILNLSIIIPSPTALLPGDSASISCQDSSLVPEKLSVVLPTLPAPPPPPCSRLATVYSGSFTAPPSPTPQSSGQKEASVINCQTVPPPPAPLPNGLSKSGTTPLQSRSSVRGGNIPTPPVGKGKFQLRASGRVHDLAKKTSLKPYHWLKLTRAMYGSIWAEAQKPEEASKYVSYSLCYLFMIINIDQTPRYHNVKGAIGNFVVFSCIIHPRAPELDMSELESLFSATVSNSDLGGAIGKTSGRASGLKSEKVHLIELRRAYNCEIMLTKVKNSILALDDSKLDVDQVDNLIKFCPTKEEMELLKNYTGNQENLGKCEQFFLELMKVPRAESKLRIFSFKIQFHSQVSDLRNSLNIVNSASGEVRNSVKLKRIMQTILSLGNALNHGTARGSAVGFRLDSLLKLTETRSINKKLTLMHYLCKVLAEKLPEVIDFQKDLVSLEAATKIQLKYLAEEMQAISKGLEKVAQELSASENDGLVSKNFYKTLKDFLEFGEAEVRSLASLYSGVGKNADALAFYFGEDPGRCPFEQVVSTLLSFVRMFLRCHNENCKQLEYEKKKALKEAETNKDKSNSFTRPESETMNLNT